MDKEIKIILDSLNSLADLIVSSWASDQTLDEVWGWDSPALNRHDLAEPVRVIIRLLETIDYNAIDKDTLLLMGRIPKKVDRIKSNLVPNFYNHNTKSSISAYFSFLDWLNSIFICENLWLRHTDQAYLPPAISRRLRGLQAKIEGLDFEADEFKAKINIINDATSAAESLPSDLKDLRDARVEIEKVKTDISKILAKVSVEEEQISKYLNEIESNKSETDRLVKNCEDAYRITTSTGLAGAFDDRSRKLSKSMLWWICGLLLSLAVAGWIGFLRVQILTNTLALPDSNFGVIFGHIVLAILSLGAPLWFAWLSTKQIGQLFKLAEDYGYKASVAKAYEGYRKEASRIDAELEHRLLESALSRVEEAPLRLVDMSEHSSPWHEIIHSKGLQDFLKKNPDEKNKLWNLLFPFKSSTDRADFAEKGQLISEKE